MWPEEREETGLQEETETDGISSLRYRNFGDIMFAGCLSLGRISGLDLVILLYSYIPNTIAKYCHFSVIYQACDIPGIFPYVISSSFVCVCFILCAKCFGFTGSQPNLTLSSCDSLIYI